VHIELTHWTTTTVRTGMHFHWHGKPKYLKILLEHMSCHFIMQLSILL